jgi:hypothetical protein
LKSYLRTATTRFLLSILPSTRNNWTLSAHMFVKLNTGTFYWNLCRHISLLTCICLRRRLFLVTLEIWRTVINLAYRDIVTSQRGHWPLLIRTRFVCTCVGAGSGMGGGIIKIKAIRWGAYYYSLVLNAQPCKYDMYKFSLRHIHDPVLSSLKMKCIRFFFVLSSRTYDEILKNICLHSWQYIVVCDTEKIRR